MGGLPSSAPIPGGHDRVRPPLPGAGARQVLALPGPGYAMLPWWRRIRSRII